MFFKRNSNEKGVLLVLAMEIGIVTFFLNFVRFSYIFMKIVIY